MSLAELLPWETVFLVFGVVPTLTTVAETKRRVSVVVCGVENKQPCQVCLSGSRTWRRNKRRNDNVHNDAWDTSSVDTTDCRIAGISPLEEDLPSCPDTPKMQANKPTNQEALLGGKETTKGLV